MRPTTTRARVRIERGIYLQPNGNYAVCWRHAGRLRFRTIGPDLDAARRERVVLIAATRSGTVAVSPRLRFDTVAGWWLERFEAKVAAGERHPRTLEAHQYHLHSRLLPTFAGRRVASITVKDIADLLLALQRSGCSPKTSAGALATLHSILRYFRRHGWISTDPVDQLEHHERPHTLRRCQRVLGREEIERLLAVARSRDRLMIATALYTGLRISELLGLIWDDVDFRRGEIRVRAQLSRAHRGAPAKRVPPKTRASVRDIPLMPQIARVLARHKQASPFSRGEDWVFATSTGNPHGARNVTRRGLQRTARLAGLERPGLPNLRFHDLRHTFASHLILDLGLDVAQVSHILGHASVTITLDVYTHLFDDARHARDIRRRMAASPFGKLLELPERITTAGAITRATCPRATSTRSRSPSPAYSGLCTSLSFAPRSRANYMWWPDFGAYDVAVPYPARARP